MGWQAATTQWVVFLDDDVVPLPSWSQQLAADLTAPNDVGATQAVIVVPRPQDRRLTDQERNVAALENAGWITADLAVRRTALIQLRGFDERFPRAYREDSDFALRAAAAGWRFEHGSRTTHHPLRTGRWWSSVSSQRGNRDDALDAGHPRSPLDHPTRSPKASSRYHRRRCRLAGGSVDGTPASRRGIRPGVDHRNGGAGGGSHSVGPADAPRGCGDARDQRRHPPGRHLVVVYGPRSVASRQGSCMGRCVAWYCRVSMTPPS